MKLNRGQILASAPQGWEVRSADDKIQYFCGASTITHYMIGDALDRTEYEEYGVLHRSVTEGPAIIQYWPNGDIYSRYVQDGIPAQNDQGHQGFIYLAQIDKIITY